MASSFSLFFALRLLVVLAVLGFFGASPSTASEHLDARSLSSEHRATEGSPKGSGAAGCTTQPREKAGQALLVDGDIDPIAQPRGFVRISSSTLSGEIDLVQGRDWNSTVARSFWTIGKLSQGPPEPSIH